MTAPRAAAAALLAVAALLALPHARAASPAAPAAPCAPVLGSPELDAAFDGAWACAGVSAWALVPALWAPLRLNVTCPSDQARAPALRVRTPRSHRSPPPAARRGARHAG